jgi:hypothetical protein
MQVDGNVVLYDGLGGFYNAWDTWGNPGAYLRLYDGGILRVVSSAGAIVWISSSYSYSC